MPGLDPFSGRTAVRSGGPLSLSLRLDTARFAVSVYRRVKGSDSLSAGQLRRFLCGHGGVLAASAFGLLSRRGPSRR